MSDAERVELGISGHSVHGSLPDWAAAIGEFPQTPFEIVGKPHAGSSESVVELLGNWSIKGPVSKSDQALRYQRAARPTSRLYVTGENRLRAVEQQYEQRMQLYQYVSRSLRVWMERTGK
eukprot:5806911-Pleurochrysis_carterae.AAC.1